MKNTIANSREKNPETETKELITNKEAENSPLNNQRLRIIISLK